MAFFLPLVSCCWLLEGGRLDREFIFNDQMHDYDCMKMLYRQKLWDLWRFDFSYWELWIIENKKILENWKIKAKWKNGKLEEMKILANVTWENKIMWKWEF